MSTSANFRLVRKEISGRSSQDCLELLKAWSDGSQSDVQGQARRERVVVT